MSLVRFDPSFVTAERASIVSQTVVLQSFSRFQFCSSPHNPAYACMQGFARIFSVISKILCRLSEFIG